MAVAVNLFEAEQSLVSGVCRKHTGMHTCMYTPEYMHAQYTQTCTHGYTHTCVCVCVCVIVPVANLSKYREIVDQRVF